MNIPTRWLPTSCSRLRIFICYAREDRELAREIGQTLTNDGHDVFIDANSLKVATDFNEEIRRAIGRADRFVFLASRHSLAPDAYPQTELGFAQKRWPSPKGTAWPVLVDPSIDPTELPLYLRSVQVHTPKGNIVADLAAELEASRSVRASCILGAVAALALIIGAGALAATHGFAPSSYVLHVPQQVDFRPAARPGPDDGWKTSPAALTLIPVNYSNDGGRPVRVVAETVQLSVSDRVVTFKWHNEVEMRPRGCEGDWLCTKTSVGASTLEANGTLRRETMFMPEPAARLAWNEFIDSVCRSNGDTLDITLTAETRATGLFGGTSAMRQATCRLDLKAMREDLQKRGCLTDADRPPTRLAWNCPR